MKNLPHESRSGGNFVFMTAIMGYSNGVERGVRSSADNGDRCHAPSRKCTRHKRPQPACREVARGSELAEEIRGGFLLAVVSDFLISSNPPGVRKVLNKGNDT